MDFLFTVGVKQEFEAAHKLEGDFGPASSLHGHTYQVEVEISGKEVDKKGILFDLGQLKESLNKVIAPLHCRYLNELEAFKAKNPTAENVSRYILECLLPEIENKNKNIRRLKVTVWESSFAFACCSIEL